MSIAYATVGNGAIEKDLWETSNIEFSLTIKVAIKTSIIPQTDGVENPIPDSEAFW